MFLLQTPPWHVAELVHVNSLIHYTLYEYIGIALFLCSDRTLKFSSPIRRPFNFKPIAFDINQKFLGITIPRNGRISA